MRIRALKPGFFKNEQLAELSPWHRLCFEGLWLCADREGRLQDRPKRLKAEIFPYDDLDVNQLLWDLMRAGFIVRYLIGGHPYICLPTWHDHQHPRQDEGASTFPAYEPGSERQCVDPSTFPAARPVQLVERPVVPETVTEASLQGDDGSAALRIGQLDNWTSGSGTSGVAPLPRQPARAADLLELWNATTHPPIPRCRELTDERRRKIRARLTKRSSLTEWRTVFEKIQASAFCRGETDRGWVADFDWVMRNDTIPARVLEGRYDDRAPPQTEVRFGKGVTNALHAVAQLSTERT